MSLGRSLLISTTAAILEASQTRGYVQRPPTLQLAGLVLLQLGIAQVVMLDIAVVEAKRARRQR